MVEGASGRRIKRDGGTGWQTETATDAAGFSDRATSTRTREEDNGRARRDEREERGAVVKGGGKGGSFPSRVVAPPTRATVVVEARNLATVARYITDIVAVD